ncbi:MAG TPA: undecaprenyl-diphosphate phosphatase [Acidobacteriota bacterium]|nr:undecaprenyl-diphosphate phosphatase [Acidobacteriota bacterium]
MSAAGPATSAAILLGILQGLTEFLPVSSSGHLGAVQLLFSDTAYPGVTLELATHLGTTVAVLVYYRELLSGMLRHRPGPALLGIERSQWWLLLLVGTLPTAIIGVLSRDAVLAAFGSLNAIAAGLALSGVFLMASRLQPQADRPIDWKTALLIGVVQGIAIFPGVSRSGLTISAALMAKVHPAQAVTFSLLLSVPAILGASVLDAVQLSLSPAPAALLFSHVLFATLAAGLVGYFCIGFVHRATHIGWWYRFAWYCWLGALVLLAAAR